MIDKIFWVAVFWWVISVLIATVGMVLNWSLPIIFTAYIIVMVSCAVIVMIAIQKWIER